MPSEERTDTLQYLKDHIEDSLGKMDVDSPTIEDLESVISEMASADSYGQEKVNGERQTSPVGKISLICAIVGIALPILVALVVAILVEDREQSKYLHWCMLCFVGMEVVALGTGIAGRTTGCGKAGLTISSISLFVSLAGGTLLMS